MPRKHRPRKGSLQFWPRKRARKIIPSANWEALEEAKEGKKEGLMGFVGYKVGMATSSVQDLTPNSMTINENLVVPSTVIECPPIKIFSVRLYQGKDVKTEILAKNLDKELKRKVKIPKENKDKKIDMESITNVKVICYTQPKLSKLKKTPDIFEIGIKADSIEKKFEIANSFLGKEINVSDIFSTLEVVDVRGVTKGKGFSGPMARFGIGLKNHKSEKGRRRPGSLGPWTPTKVSFRAPMAGQLGFFSRVQYNNQIIHQGTKEDIKILKDFKNYGVVNSSFLIMHGTLQGPSKRPLFLTSPLRKTKRVGKKNFKFIKIIK